MYNTHRKVAGIAEENQDWSSIMEDWLPQSDLCGSVCCCSLSVVMWLKLRRRWNAWLWFCIRSSRQAILLRTATQLGRKSESDPPTSQTKRQAPPCSTRLEHGSCKCAPLLENVHWRLTRSSKLHRTTSTAQLVSPLWCVAERRAVSMPVTEQKPCERHPRHPARARQPIQMSS